jgi:alkanesulfonate monooxygenase SsuD/methylene tetrahydromethanopterin reductase-like flavin-dependent oxidoreductase (luciferase family)
MGIPYFHRRVFQRNFDFLRETCAKQGYTPDPEQLGWLVPVYVGDTDEQAWAEYEPHLRYFAKRLLAGIESSPPGYTSARSVLHLMKARGDFMIHCETRADFAAGDFVIVGSVQTVREKMAALIESFGVGNILALLQLGTLPADLTRRNMERYAREVIPYLRQRFERSAAHAA